MKKKILAVFLSLCMAMSLLPVTALAAGNDETETQTPTESSITTEEALKNAIDNTPAGGTVTLDEDIVITAPVVINKQITLDLNEKEIYAEKNIWNDKDKDWSLISVREKGDLTITGKGTLKALANDSFAVDVMDGGSCTIENGTFVGNVHAVYVFQGTLVVKDGTFSVQQTYSAAQPYEFVLNCYDANYKNGSSSITVNGGTFVNFNPANCKAEGEGTSFMSSDCESTSSKEGETTYWTVTKKETISVVKPEKATDTVDATVGGVAIPSDTGSGDITTEGKTLTLDATVTDDSDTVTTSNVTVGGTALNTIAKAVNVANVAIETDVGTLTVSKAALGKIVESAEEAANNGITPDVTLSIEKVDTTAADNGVTYNVNATVAVGGTTKEVFTEASADSNATIQVSVPAPTDVTSENVHVYYLGPNGAEEVSGAKVEDKNVSWTVEHFSTYYVTADEQKVSVTDEDGNTSTYATLQAAIDAADAGDTIKLMSDIEVSNDSLTGNVNTGAINISKSLTIDGNGYTISAANSWRPTSAGGNANHIINVEQPTTGDAIGVTIKNLTIDGKNEKTKHGINVFTVASQTNKATVTLKDVTIQNCGTAGLVINNSTVTATNLVTSRNPWYGVNVDPKSDTGKAVFTLNGSKSNIGETGGIVIDNKYGDDNTGDDNATVTINDGYVAAITENDGNSTASTAITVKGGSFGESVAEYVKGDLKYEANANGIYTYHKTLDAALAVSNNVSSVEAAKPGATFVTVTVKNGNDVDTIKLTSGTEYSLPDYPDQGYNHFQGWRDQDGKTYEGGTKVENITKDMTFTAVWSYIPPANPNYRIDIPAAEGGTVTADPAAAKAGATVTLTATPDEGYAVGTITVTDRFGDAVKVTENADGTYTFTMPNGQVTVKATFVETEEPAPAMPFTDVKEGDWFYDEVLYVYENSLMNGVGDNRFAPNSATTRGMLVTILYRLEGEPDVTGEAGFDDVGDTWYTDAVIWAAANDIVNGIGDNQFGPENTLTREQLVTMLYRYAQNKGYDVTASADLSGYPDAGQIQSWAQEAMTWAVAEGIVEGMDGNLNPAGSATRAQIATILMRFCEGVAK